jgi:hypothetical protein
VAVLIADGAGITVAGLAAQVIASPRQQECRCNLAMRITSETVADGIREQLFAIGDIPVCSGRPPMAPVPVRWS